MYWEIKYRKFHKRRIQKEKHKFFNFFSNKIITNYD